MYLFECKNSISLSSSITFVLLLICSILGILHGEESKYITSTYTVVVARYTEDVEWLRPIFQNCLIYNKGSPLGNVPYEIPLPNVGRESETYLQYIITHYDNFPDIVVFTQARIADHRGSDDYTYLLRLRNEAIDHFISRPTLLFYQNKDTPDNRWDPDWNYDGNGKWFWEDNYYEGVHLTFEDYFVKYIAKYYPNPFQFTSNAIFAVQSSMIRSRPKSFYETLLRTVNHHNNPVEGAFIEKSWYYIFFPEITKATRQRMIAKAPWMRCKDALHSLPLQKHLTSTNPSSSSNARYHQLLEYAILTCGLFPYQPVHFAEEKFPKGLRPYTGQDGIGLHQYPTQFTSYLSFLESFFTSPGLSKQTTVLRYVEVGMKMGGSFIITTEFLQRLGYMDVDSIGIDIEDVGQPNWIHDKDNKEKSNTSVLYAYEDNLFSYISMHTHTMLKGNTAEFFRHMPYSHYDLVFLDSIYDAATINSQSTYFTPFAKVLVYSRIVDSRYPAAINHWQRLKARYPEYCIEFTEQYDDEILFVEGRNKLEDGRSESYYGIGVFVNPIYYSCGKHFSPDSTEFRHSCQPRAPLQRCMSLIATLSIQQERLPQQLSHAIASCGLSTQFLNTDIVTSFPLPSQYLVQDTFNGVAIFQSPRQFSTFLLTIAQFPITNIVMMYNVFEDIDGSLIVMMEFLKKYSQDSHAMRDTISKEKPERDEMSCVIVVEESYASAFAREEQRKQQTSPEREAEYVQISHLVREYMQGDVAVSIVSGGIPAFMQAIEKQQQHIGLWLIDARHFTYEHIMQIVMDILPMTSKIAFTYMHESNEFQRVKEKLCEKYGKLQWVEVTEDYPPKDKKYFGIGLFFNPQFVDCYVNKPNGVVLCTHK